MHASLNRRRPVAILAATLGAIGLCAAIAVAAPIGTGGTTQLRMENRTETTPVSTSSLNWVNVSAVVAGWVPVPIADNTTRLINARFTGESYCDGPNAGFCTVRIVAVNAVAGATIELNPAAGTDFAFDADPAGAADDMWEGNAIERSYRLPAGSWSIRVQYAVTNAATVFRLDDWHLAVESSQ